MPVPELPRLIYGASHATLDSFDFLDRWYESGGRALDTARVYGVGASERAIGQWMSERNIGDVSVITKGCHHDEKGSRLDPVDLREDLERSREALGLSCIPVYLLHRDDEERTAASILESLQPYLEQGWIASIGTSNWRHQRIAQANEHARSQGLEPFRFNSPQYSAVAPTRPAWPGCISISGDEDAISWHRDQEDLHLLAWQPLASGYLALEDVAQGNKESIHTFVSPENEKTKSQMIEQARAKGETLAQTAIRWLMSQPRVHAIIGTRRLDNWASAQSVVEG